MDIRPIRIAEDYRAMLAEVSALVDMDPDPDTPEGERLDVLSTLLEAYEKKRFPIEAPTAVAAIRFRMEQQGLSVKDLEPIVGRSNRFYEIMNGKRSLSMAMVKNLHRELGIPYESLLSA